MAHIDEVVGGKKIERYLAGRADVQSELRSQALAHALRAEALLGPHRSDRKGGHSSIKVTRGTKRVDWYVELNDEDGDQAAWAIEFGRSGYFMAGDDDDSPGHSVGGTDGLFVLHRAFGLGGH
jgi:hypothetical protein